MKKVFETNYKISYTSLVCLLILKDESLKILKSKNSIFLDLEKYLFEISNILCPSKIQYNFENYSLSNIIFIYIHITFINNNRIYHKRLLSV